MALNMLSVWTSRSMSTKQAEPLNVEPINIEADNADNERPVDVDAVAPVEGEEASPQVEETTAETAPATPRLEATVEQSANPDRPPSNQKRFSFRSIGLFNGQTNSVTHEQDATERRKAGEAAKYASLSMLSFSPGSRAADNRVQRNALAVQRLIVGPDSSSLGGAKAGQVSRAQLTKIKSELIQPKSANKLIAKIRVLPILEEPSASGNSDAKPVTAKTSGPIHAVCLESNEAEMKEKHFSKLGTASVATASLGALAALFEEMHIVDLLSAPDLGFGQPGDGVGLLAGAVPTAETVIEGIEKLTPQLMALGYATGKAILPDHTNVHPPVDRMSVITYWWGLELCLPPPTLTHLDSADNITHEVVNFLTAFAVMNDGVREILPFVRYISQFVDFEFKAIKAQDEGKGVVCAATWIMPAAMVPRPWDFPDTPAAVGRKDERSAADAPRTGQGVVEDIMPASGGLLPTLVVTPPSIIKGGAVPETSEGAK